MGEIDAMGAIDKAMTGLEQDEQKRVLRWAVDKFSGGAVTVEQDRQGPSRSGGANGSGGDGGGTGSYQRITDLMDAAHPSSIVDHVLVASYWFQVVRGQENFAAQDVNAALKDLGHPSKNITDSYASLMKRKPSAARQVQKAGSTRQARKRYRLTDPGIRTVEQMIRGESE